MNIIKQRLSVATTNMRDSTIKTRSDDRRFVSKIKITKLLLLLFLMMIALPFTVQAVGINTNVALPVPKGHFLVRTQARYTRATKDPTGSGNRLHLVQFPNVLVYGITSKTAAFGVLPIVYRDLTMGTSSSNVGIGDITLFVRQELFKKDWALKTFRVAVLGGIEIPSGDSPFSSNSVDVPLGVVTSYQTHRQEIDLDLRYKINTNGNGVDHGDDFIYNLAYQIRILPWKLPETGVPNQLNFVIEANGKYTQTDRTGGASVANTGGNTIFISPGIQFVTKRVIYEASFQIPVAQNLKGNQLETRWSINGGTRVQF